MGGTGDTVKYTKEFLKEPTDQQKKDLKEKITKIIDSATAELTIIALAKQKD